jgi:hypothetical protein
MLFAAFISYKHTEPDRKWAAWLHKKLETYRVPRGIPAPQLGTRRIGRVFRDDEELAAGIFPAPSRPLWQVPSI